jgi:hypothetical protein
MATTGLSGPWPLTDDKIDALLKHASPGAYALGRADKDNTLYVEYVGRSDNDLKKRLHDHVGKYSAFKCDYFESAKAAFAKECHLYHDFKPAGNKVHPARPDKSNWTCPRCYVFD